MIIYCNTLTKKLDKPIEKTPDEENRNMDKLVEKRKLGRPISDYDRKRAVRIMNRLLRGWGMFQGSVGISLRITRAHEYICQILGMPQAARTKRLRRTKPHVMSFFQPFKPQESGRIEVSMKQVGYISAGLMVVQSEDL